MIKFEEGAVCYAYCSQFYSGEHYHELVSKANHGCSLEHALKANVFQLNEIRQGDYIPASELDTEQKYNDAVEVFGLFGFARYEGAEFGEYTSPMIVVDEDGDFISCEHGDEDCKRKITYSQLMAIGELKRKMLEREKSTPKITPDLTPHLTQENKRRNKSKKAYDILNGLDYEYDEVKQRWYKKEWF